MSATTSRVHGLDGTSVPFGPFGDYSRPVAKEAPKAEEESIDLEEEIGIILGASAPIEEPVETKEIVVETSEDVALVSEAVTEDKVVADTPKKTAKKAVKKESKKTSKKAAAETAE